MDFKETVDFRGGEMEICLQFATFMQSNKSVLRGHSHRVVMWRSCQRTRWHTETLTSPFGQP